jgi:hypothetical protein
VKSLQKWEYRVLQSASNAITHLNERMNSMAADGWECVGISGDQMVCVLMRRPAPPVDQAVAEAPPPPPQAPA